MTISVTSPDSNNKKIKINKELLMRLAPLFSLIILVLFFSFSSPFFFNTENIMTIALQTSVIGIMAIGVTFVIITAGIDLSLGSVVAFSGVAVGICATLGLPLPVCIIAGVLAGGLCGYVNGLLVTKMTIPPFIATLGLMMSVRGINMVMTDGRAIYFADYPMFKTLAQGRLFDVLPYPVFYLVIVALVGAYILKKTVIGRYVYAVGSNEVAAHLSGIKVQRVKIFVYAFCGLLTGIAGVILASRLNSGQPTVGVGYELEAIAAVVIGGTSLMGGIGTIGGTIIGAFIMSVLKNGLNLMGVSQFWQMVAMGVVVVAAVYLDTLRKRFVDLGSLFYRETTALTLRVIHSERSTTMKTRHFIYALSLLACVTSSALAKDLNLPVVSKGFQHEFWQTVKMGTEAAAKELGDKTSYVGPADETQIAEQIQLVENAMAQKPNGLLLAALDANALAPLVETANSRGIKVVTFDSGINSDIPVSFVATNNRKAGAQAADALAAQVNNKGKVGIIAHVAGTSSAIERSEGFMERMKEKYPDIKVLPVQYSDGDPQKAMDKTIDMIQANPDLAGIYGTNEGSTLGVANAIDSQNLKGKVKVIGFDSTEAIINFLKNGVIQGFVVQDAYQIGYQGIKTLNAALSGQAVEKEIDIPVKFVNAENINTPEIDKLLHPFGKK